jgi:hypothetical protein
MAKDKKTERKYKTLLSVLANGSELESRALLKKHSGQDAQDTKDLEVKLARVYALSPIKIEIEKEFAEIHPHKDFILKYFKPEPIIIEKDITKVTNLAEEPVTIVPKQVYSKAEGENQCNCHKCMGGYSNASGSEQPIVMPKDNNSIMVVGIVSIVAIFGMVLYLKNNK